MDGRGSPLQHRLGRGGKETHRLLELHEHKVSGQLLPSVSSAAGSQTHKAERKHQVQLFSVYFRTGVSVFLDCVCCALYCLGICVLHNSHSNPGQVTQTAVGLEESLLCSPSFVLHQL